MMTHFKSKQAWAAQQLANIIADTALLNSILLIMSTGVMAVSGFIFWYVSARLYTPAQLGLSSTLIAAATTLALFSMLGFDNVLVRFLPTAKKPNRVIDTGIMITILASIILSVIFILALSSVSPSLNSLLFSPLHKLIFVLSLVFVTINTITDSIFISFRSTKYILFANTGLSFGKVILPLLLVASGAYGLFIAYAVSVTIASLMSLYFLRRKYDYIFKPHIDRTVLREVRHFSAGTYTSNMVAVIPMTALPIIVTNTLGSEQAAFFNLAMTIAAMLFIVPKSMANSLFAEGAKNAQSFRRQTFRTTSQAALLLIPAVAVLLVGGHFLLSIFGTSYAVGATSALQVLALSSLGLGLNAIAQTILKVRHRLLPLFLIQSIGTVITVFLCWPLARSYGATGAAWAWLIGQYVMAALHAVTIARINRNPSPVPATQSLKNRSQEVMS